MWYISTLSRMGVVKEDRISEYLSSRAFHTDVIKDISSESVASLRNEDRRSIPLPENRHV